MQSTVDPNREVWYDVRIETNPPEKNMRMSAKFKPQTTAWTRNDIMTWVNDRREHELPDSLFTDEFCQEFMNLFVHLHVDYWEYVTDGKVKRYFNKDILEIIETMMIEPRLNNRGSMLD